MKKNKKNKVSTQKRKKFWDCIWHLMYGFVIGYFFATPYTNEAKYGLLIAAFVCSLFGICDLFFWRFAHNNERKKTEK